MDVLIDIETLPIDAYEGMDIAAHVASLPPPEPPKRYKKPESIAKWQRENAEAEWRKSVFRFDGVRVGCVGVISKHDALVMSGPERDVLRDTLAAIPDRGRLLVWGDYDARVLRARMLAHGIPFGPLSTAGKPWERRVTDLQGLIAEALNGYARNTKGISVDAVCSFLGVERSDNPIDGAGVLDAYVEGRWQDVIDHCRADVRDEWACWVRLRDALGLS